jgi:hypothetical protein
MPALNNTMPTFDVGWEPAKGFLEAEKVDCKMAGRVIVRCPKGRRPVNDTIYMQWLLLRAVPRYPRRISAADLEKILKENGIDTTRRTIERTLCRMLEYPMFAIDRDDKKPRGWYWSGAESQLSP